MLPDPWILDAEKGGNCAPGSPGCYNIPQNAGVYGFGIDPFQIAEDAALSALDWLHQDWCSSSRKWSKGEANYAKYATLAAGVAAGRGKEGLAGWLAWSSAVAAASSTAEDLLQEVTLCR